MGNDFGSRIKDLRIQKGLSQQQLADMVFVNRTSVTNWETGRRIPDVIMIKRLADCLGVNVNTLLDGIDTSSEKPEIIVVDDEKMIVSEVIDIVGTAIPNASITGFTKASEAMEYAKSTRIDIALLDIEIGIPSGLDLCKSLLEMHPETNVIFLTAFEEYAFDAWGTGACGFLLKPLTVEDVKKQLEMLRHPVAGLEIE